MHCHFEQASTATALAILAEMAMQAAIHPPYDTATVSYYLITSSKHYRLGDLQYIVKTSP